MAAVKRSFKCLGVRKPLAPQQRTTAARAFHAGRELRSVSKLSLDTKKPAYRAGVAVRSERLDLLAYGRRAIPRCCYSDPSGECARHVCENDGGRTREAPRGRSGTPTSSGRWSPGTSSNFRRLLVTCSSMDPAGTSFDETVAARGPGGGIAGGEGVVDIAGPAAMAISGSWPWTHLSGGFYREPIALLRSTRLAC